MADKFELDLGDSVVEFDHEPTDQEISSVLSEIKSSSLPPQPKTLAGKSSDILSSLTSTLKPNLINTSPSKFSGAANDALKFLTPPTSPMDLLAKPAYLEEGGQRVKDVFGESLGNIARKPSNINPELKAAGLTALSSLKAAPYKPSEFGGIVASEIFPLLGSKVLKNWANSINNRFINAPAPIALGRLGKGEVPVGEDFAKMGEQVPDLIDSDKKKIYDVASKKIGQLAEKVSKKIDSIYESSKTAKPMTPFTKPVSDVSVRTRDLLEGVGKSVEDMQEVFGVDSSKAKQIKDFVDDFMQGKPDFLNIKQLDKLRTSLGDVIGKRFDKDVDDLPELTQALRTIWGNAREKLSKISPEVSKDLKTQHILFDIRNSVSKNAAQGFKVLPSGLWQAVRDSIAKSPNVAKVYKVASDVIEKPVKDLLPSGFIQGTKDLLK